MRTSTIQFRPSSSIASRFFRGDGERLMNRDIADKAIRRRDTRLWVALIKLSCIGGTDSVLSEIFFMSVDFVWTFSI